MPSRAAFKSRRGPAPIENRVEAPHGPDKVRNSDRFASPGGPFDYDPETSEALA